MCYAQYSCRPWSWFPTPVRPIKVCQNSVGAPKENCFLWASNKQVPTKHHESPRNTTTYQLPCLLLQWRGAVDAVPLLQLAEIPPVSTESRRKCSAPVSSEKKTSLTSKESRKSSASFCLPEGIPKTQKRFLREASTAWVYKECGDPGAPLGNRHHWLNQATQVVRCPNTAGWVPPQMETVPRWPFKTIPRKDVHPMRYPKWIGYNSSGV